MSQLPEGALTEAEAEKFIKRSVVGTKFWIGLCQPRTPEVCTIWATDNTAISKQGVVLGLDYRHEGEKTVHCEGKLEMSDYEVTWILFTNYWHGWAWVQRRKQKEKNAQ
jgi:hypothetical protein